MVLILMVLIQIALDIKDIRRIGTQKWLNIIVRFTNSSTVY